MAVGGQLSQHTTFKEQFDDQLTCGVCLEQYTNPKTLPCLHSFCLECVEPLPVDIKDGKYYISCPTCRVDHLLPQGGANSFSDDFKINSFLDLRKKLMSTQKSMPTQVIESFCSKHNDPKRVYCETCDQVICRDCTISAEHNKHTYHLVSECYPKYHQQILDNLDPVKCRLDDMNTAIAHLDTTDGEVFEQGENIKEQINTCAQQLIDGIEQSRTRLTQQVDTIVQQKTNTLATQRQQAQKLRTQLEICRDMIDKSLKEWSKQLILEHKNTMIDGMTSVTEHVDPTVFQPIEVANIQFSKCDEKDLDSIKITSRTYGTAILEASQYTAKHSSTTTLILYSQDGSPFSLPPSLISAALSSPGDENSVKCPITQTHELGKYNITFTPSTRKIQLVVQVGGVDVPDSPFTLPVIPAPDMRGEPLNIITGLKPFGISVCDNGDIVVAENGSHCVTILNKNGEKVKKLGDVEKLFKYPRGVAVSLDGHILVTDNHRLQKLTIDGVCVKSVGSAESGRGHLEFHYPSGITINHATGHIYIADYSNNRIQVFTNDLTFFHTITRSSRLLSACRIKDPYGVAMDNEGFLYVAGNNSIKKNINDGRYFIKIVRKGSGPGQLSHPSFLTIHDNLVYVCEYGNNRVSIFDTDGKFCHQVGRDGLLNSPCGIAMDTLGNLYVSDTGNNRILVF